MKKFLGSFLLLTLAMVLLITGCGTKSGTEEQSTEAPAEAPTAEPYTGMIDYDTYGGGVANWVDDVYKDGGSIASSGEGKKALLSYNYAFDSGDYGLDSITMRGWLGLEDEMDSLGYSFDNGAPTYVNAFEETEDAVIGVAGAYAKRFELTADTSGLGVGTHTLNLVAKLKDGREIIFNGAYKEPTMDGNIPYEGNIITTITLTINERKEIPTSEKGQEVCRQAKIVADFCRQNGFTYGDAGINPAINWAELSADKAINPNQRKFSCDRLCCWALYRAGYTDQPYTQGLVVWNPGGNDLSEYCEKWGFIKITKWSELQPGDIVFVGSAGASHPGHVYIHADWVNGDVGGDADSRYDGGSDWRIQQVQPYVQSQTAANEIFWYAYRPV